MDWVTVNSQSAVMDEMRSTENCSDCVGHHQITRKDVQSVVQCAVIIIISYTVTSQSFAFYRY